MKLEWLDPSGGIHDQTHWGTEYVSGTGIIFSKKMLSDFLQKKIDYSIIDDVSIGKTMKEFPDIKRETFHNEWLSLQLYADETQIEKEITKKPYIFFRNRCSENRAHDIRQMKRIIQVLQKDI